ncbi:MAG: YqjK-like family protein [Thiobacillus sp.]|nr:YqjK-like family protein [Thiobacillus sp.]
MSSTRARLAARRQQLVAQADAQRTALTSTLEPWRARLARVDRGLAVLRYVKRYPLVLGGASLLLARVRPGRIVRWLQRGWMMWQFGRRLRRQ